MTRHVTRPRPLAWLIAGLLLLLWPCLGLTQPLPIGPGVTHERIVREEGPWVIDVIRLARDQERVGLQAVLGKGQVLGRATLADQLPAASPDSRAIAAVNGDFFVMAGPDAGTTRSAHIAGGRLIRSGAGSPALLWGADGQLAIRDVRFGGKVGRADGTSCPLAGVNQPIPEDGLVLYTADYGPRSRDVEGQSVALRVDDSPFGPRADLTARVVEKLPGARDLGDDRVAMAGRGTGQAFVDSLAIGEEVAISWRSPGSPEWAVGCVSGGPTLIREGEIVGGDNIRNPRTAAGFSESELVLVTVDGRRAGWSVGMTQTELAELLEELGCVEALNLDGGGSTTMWVRGEVKNRPSDGASRSVASGLAVVLAGALGAPAHLRVEPQRIWGLPGARVPLDVEVTDADHNPLVASAELHTECAGPVELADDALIAEFGERTGTGSVRLSAGPVVAIVPVHVLDEPASAAMLPQRAWAVPGDALPFRLSLLGPGRELLAAPAGLVPVFTADPWLGEIDEKGVLSVADDARSGVIRGSAAGVEATARIDVAEALVVSDGEALPPFKFSAYPADGPTGRVRLETEQRAAGTACVALDFDLGDAVASRAAYANLDAQVGRAIGFSAQLRAIGCTPWVRLAYTDGNGTVHRETLVDRLADGAEWQAARVRLPDGTKPPVTVESIYVVETNAERQPQGTLYIDDVTAWVVP